MSEFRSFRIEAVVLRHADWGEADRILTLFTRKRGKLRVVAKGARRIRSRKAGHLEPFTHVLLQLARGRDLSIVTQAETLEAYIPIREDLIKTATASYLVELVDRFTYEEGSENISLFHLLIDTLGRVADQPEPWVAVRYFEMHLLDFLGFRPQLFKCANCRERIEPVNQYFSVAQGGVLCPRCGAGLPGVREVSVETLKYLRHFQRSDYSQASRAHPALQARVEIEALMQNYLTYLLERGLNSPNFLKEIQP
ncbi:MAG: DNA repair protein RecO [Anaerolineales bacterium]|nr:DNA repair protein RecO [Anaerolineales bacterium]